ncbi:class I SAM-dependent methyltransferase [Rhizobium lentis]|uniref:SAM-dependent methyltransferase n=1 Tax=Rhizobium lentis TaxID=1138194 RepID=A0A7W9CYK4_9HYPH|nr:class I SAM-dependent methyltransferase [Rhizobium lentis]MBB4577132.1 SAM-dependent methyltransferase [Rhizobium lentis]MBB5553963.1 SAM-dependent methyltransferase [Rhizobium lentis]MBB5564525.1 SAM-dependent methyltransferase [Rhizobium lentis]MBB5571041.1 SAM-dependent methyltransferase [Rhizobium lentis]
MNFNDVFDERYIRFHDGLIGRASRDVDDIVRMSRAGSQTSFIEIGCGEGRLLRELAKRGFSATGMDASKVMVAEAATRAAAAGQAVDVFEWDIANGPLPKRYDVAISWFTSFGLCDDQACRTVLKSVRESLNHNGIFVMDLVNKDFLLPRLKDAIVVELGTSLMIDRLKYDSRSGHLRTDRIYVEEGKQEGKAIEFSVRLLAFPELRDWLLQAGFSDVELCTGGKDDEPFDRLRVRAST